MVTEVFGRIDARAALPGVRELADRWRPDLVLREARELASYVVADVDEIPHATVGISLDSFEDGFLPGFEGPLADLGARRGVAGLRSAPRLSLLPPAFEGAAALVSGTTRRFRDDTAVAAGSDPLPDWWPGSSDRLVYVTFGTVAAGIGLLPTLYQGVVGPSPTCPSESCSPWARRGTRRRSGRCLPTSTSSGGGRRPRSWPTRRRW